MANYTSTHTGATIDASVTIISGSGVTQSDLVKLNAVTSSAVELNLLDGVTATTAELNILDGATLSVTELNYLDGADSSITTLSLPDNTTITTFGASLIDDADAASARTTLGVDVAGTDNSTNVTLVTTSYDYLSLSGQAITLGQIDISDDTNLVGGDGLALTGDTLSVNVDDSSIEINSDTLRVKASGVTNAMLANSSLSYGGVSVALGSSDATPAFDLSDATSLPIVAGTTGTLSVARGGTGATTASGARTNLNVDVAGTDNSTDVTLVTTSHDYLSLSGQAVTLGTIDISDDTNLVGGTGITLTGDTLSTTDSEIVHDNLSGFVSNEHIDHSSVSITAGTGLSGGGDITSTRTLTTDDSAIVHDDLSGFVANEHIDHSGVSITAGAGLTGGGDITSTRDIAVGAGTGVTVNADDIAIGQDVGTSADVEFNSVTADIIGDIRGATKFQAKADVALNKGDAVYISGVSGTTPTVDIADANDSAKMPSFGLAASSVSINASVEIITFGTLAGLNTSAFSVGDIIYISTNGTSGNTLTATVPTGESSLIQNIGIVQRSHASAGSIKVGGAGRTNATPNLNDGNIFIGNGSNEPVTAALNTKIQDYLNTGVNLPSPTFSGDIDFSDASTPQLDITDTTNNITTRISSNNSTGNIGTSTDHQLNILRNNVANITLFSGYTMHNNDGNDLDFRAKDSSGNVVFKVNAGTSTTEIGTLSVTGNSVLAGDLQVNGTTTTVNQTNLDVSDNIIGLNRGAASNANDSGLIIERGSTGDNVFIGWDESLDRIRFATTASDASSTGDLSLTNANIHAGRLYADVSGDVTGNADTATALATARNFSLTGDVTAGAVSFDGSGNVALATTIAANSVALGTDTTGNYMSDLTEGTGIDISHTPGEGSNGTITLDLTEVGFGGGANRLITDDGDGTVSTEANLTFDGTNLAIAGAGKLYFGGGSHTYISEDIDDRLRFFVGGAEMFRLNEINDFASFFTDVAMASGDKLYFDGGGNTYITESSADVLKIFVGNEAKLEIDEGNENIFLNTNNLTFRTPGFTAQSKFDILNNKLGIGTTSPAGNLDVVPDTDGYARIGRAYVGNVGHADWAGYGHIDVRNGSSYALLQSTAGHTILNAASGQHLSFRINNNTADMMRISSAGNVGIGETSPEAKLHIKNASAGTFTASNSQLLIENNTTVRLSMVSPAANGCKIEFGDINDQDVGMINYDHSNNYMAFTTNASEKMRIASTGNVGIGTQSPGALLDIGDRIYLKNDGTIHWGSAAAHGVLSWDTGRAIVSSLGTNNLDLKAPSGKQVVVNESGSNVDFRVEGDTDASLLFVDASTDRVGIGTTSPQRKLHVSTGNTDIAARFENTSSNGSVAEFISSGDSRTLTIQTDHIYSNGNLFFGLGNYTNTYRAGTHIFQEDTGNTEVMRITGNNVGIGTTSPDTYNIQLASGYKIGVDNSSGGTTRIAEIEFYNTGDGSLRLKTDNASTGGIEFHTEGFQRMEVLRGGNIHINNSLGIGTTSPAQKLHISGGNARIDGDIITQPTYKVYLDGGNDTYLHEVSANHIAFNTGGAEKMRLTTGGLGVGMIPAEVLDLKTASGDCRIRLDAPNGSDTEIKFFNAGAAVWTIGHDDGTGNFVIGTTNVDAPIISVNSDGDVLPNGDGTQDLGASSKRWGIIYSADLDLSNEGSQNDVDGTWGSYVIQEGEDDLFLINRRSGKKYKFMLQEVQD